jgi:GTP diphosphokinase / guanosine-3',5'-bis(diphosphate) 3'-diphosphatase
MVHAVTKISGEDGTARTHLKIRRAIALDRRVALIKLADRLHNLRTLEHLAPEKRERIRAETLSFYIPLAKKCGLFEIARQIVESL